MGATGSIGLRPALNNMYEVVDWSVELMVKIIHKYQKLLTDNVMVSVLFASAEGGGSTP